MAPAFPCRIQADERVPSFARCGRRADRLWHGPRERAAVSRGAMRVGGEHYQTSFDCRPANRTWVDGVTICTGPHSFTADNCVTVSRISWRTMWHRFCTSCTAAVTVAYLSSVMPVVVYSQLPRRAGHESDEEISGKRSRTPGRCLPCEQPIQPQRQPPVRLRLYNPRVSRQSKPSVFPNGAARIAMLETGWGAGLESRATLKWQCAHLFLARDRHRTPGIP